MGANTCVCCGSVISEDRMVCTMCEKRGEYSYKNSTEGLNEQDKKN